MYCRVHRNPLLISAPNQMNPVLVLLPIFASWINHCHRISGNLLSFCYAVSCTLEIKTTKACLSTIFLHAYCCVEQNGNPLHAIQWLTASASPSGFISVVWQKVLCFLCNSRTLNTTSNVKCAHCLQMFLELKLNCIILLEFIPLTCVLSKES